MKQLVKFEKNWIDEFNVESFAVMDSEEIQKLFLIADIYFNTFPNAELVMTFGTSQCLIFSNYEDYRNCFTIDNIEDQEAEVFQKYFYNYSPEKPLIFGTGSVAFNISIFYDQLFDFYRQGMTPTNVIEKLKRVEPKFEDWK